MKALKVILLSLLLSVIIFLLSPAPYHFGFITYSNYWEFRVSMLYLTGAAAIILFTISMFLSLKSNYLEKYTKGYDKAVNIHKWTGITAFIMVIFHWIIKKSKGVILDFNILPAPEKGGEMVLSDTEKLVYPFIYFTDTFKKLNLDFITIPFFAGGAGKLTENEVFLYKLGNTIIEYVFYVFIILMAAAVIKRVPYHIFRKLHAFMPLIFLAAAYHSLTIQIRGGWAYSIAGLLLSIIILSGAAAALYILFAGKRHKHKSVVKNVEYDNNTNILSLTLDLDKKDFNYKAGQFALLKFPFSSEYHPFTICSCKSNESISFYIKSLGDYTSLLKDKIKTGDNVIIDGPYGRFTFDDNKNQIWIGSGIGITPFLSKLDSLDSNDKNITFYYSNYSKPFFLDKVAQKCKKLGIDFHFINTEKESRININDVINNQNLSNTSLWFCGNESFRNSIKKVLKENNFNLKKFNYEIFRFR